MEGFDKYKEIKYLLAWLLIILTTIGIAKFLEIKISIIVYFMIIVILLVYSYLKSKEAEYYKNQVLRLEKNPDIVVNSNELLKIGRKYNL